MEIAIAITCLFVALEGSAQVCRLPDYRVIDRDSAGITGDLRYPKAVRLKNDTVNLFTRSESYQFIACSIDSLAEYPVYRADFDEKFVLEIAVWEITEVGSDTIEFAITYHKRNKKTGAQNRNTRQSTRLRFPGTRSPGSTLPKEYSSSKTVGSKSHF